MSWLDDLFGPVTAKQAGVAKAKRAVWNFLSGVTITENVNGELDFTITGSDSGGATVAVADVSALRDIGPASRQDKQSRLVETLGFPKRFDADSGANGLDDGELQTKPTDLASSSNGRWYPFGTRFAVGTALLASLFAYNPTAAAVGAQQYSPAVRWTGQGWKTNATAASQTVEFAAQCRPVQGAAAPTGELHWLSQINGGGWTSRMMLDSAGKLSIGGPLAPLSGSLRFDAGTIDVRSAAGVTGLTVNVAPTGAQSISIVETVTSFALSWVQRTAGAGGALSITGQQGFAGSIGGKVTIAAGAGGTPGTNLGGGVDIDLQRNVGGTGSLLQLVAGSDGVIGDLCGAGYFRIRNGPGANNGISMLATGSGIMGIAGTIVSAECIAAGGANTQWVTAGGMNHYRAGVLARSDVIHNAGACTYTHALGVTSVTHDFADNVTNSATGASRTVKAQNATGTTTTGGALKLASGSGTSTHGTIDLLRDTTRLGFFGLPANESQFTVDSSRVGFGFLATATNQYIFLRAHSGGAVYLDADALNFRQSDATQKIAWGLGASAMTMSLSSGGYSLAMQSNGTTRIMFNSTGVAFNGQTPAARPTYTLTNHTLDRALNETADTLAQVANVLGTVISDLITVGLFQ